MMTNEYLLEYMYGAISAVGVPEGVRVEISVELDNNTRSGMAVVLRAINSYGIEISTVRASIFSEEDRLTPLAENFIDHVKERIDDEFLLVGKKHEVTSDSVTTQFQSNDLIEAQNKIAELTKDRDTWKRLHDIEFKFHDRAEQNCVKLKAKRNDDEIAAYKRGYADGTKAKPTLNRGKLGHIITEFIFGNLTHDEMLDKIVESIQPKSRD